MTRENPPKQPSGGGPGGEKPGGILDQALDVILAEAAALTNELARQVGTAVEPEPPETPAARPAPGADELVDLEAELGELERLVAGEGGGDPEIPAPADQAEPQASTDPSAAVPDFMSEFTKPAAPEDSKPSADAGPPAAPEDSKPSADAGPPTADAAPGPVVKSPKPGVVGTNDIADADQDTSPETDTPPEEPEPTPAPLSKAALARKIVGGIALRLTERLTGVGEGVVKLLELIHQQIPALDHTIRRVVGWVALATMGTSMIVFLLSLF